MRQALEVTDGRSVLFDDENGEDDWAQADDEVYETESSIEAEKLIDFPVDSHEYRLVNVPILVNLHGEEYCFDNGSLAAGRYGAVLSIHGNGKEYDWDAKKWTGDSLSIKLESTTGSTAKILGDISIFDTAHVNIGSDDEPKIDKDVRIVCNAMDNEIHIDSVDGELSLKLSTPVCAECDIPMWQFPWPPGEEKPKGRASMSAGGSFFDVSSSPDGYWCSMQTSTGNKVFCYCCADAIVEEYQAEFPLAEHNNAVERMRELLNQAGYSDVEIIDGQVWRLNSNTWEFYTAVEYERDGRKITRYTGLPELSDQGDYRLNMPSRAFVEFRY